MSTPFTGNLDGLSDQDEKEIDDWVRSPEASQIFREVAEEVQRDADAFRERISVSYGELRSPFGSVRQ